MGLSASLSVTAILFHVTYIHNWPLQPFSQDYGLASHTTQVVCVNFRREWRDLQLKVDSERQIFWETFSWQVYLLSEFLPEICWEEVAEEIFFVVCFDDWPGIRSLAFASNKPTHYILDHGDFMMWLRIYIKRQRTVDQEPGKEQFQRLNLCRRTYQQNTFKTWSIQFLKESGNSLPLKEDTRFINIKNI